MMKPVSSINELPLSACSASIFFSLPEMFLQDNTIFLQRTATPIPAPLSAVSAVNGKRNI
ncbi:MAG: hypothetical protein NTU66_00710 [Elusimicrobia bacterium]|nr:hypothetical protein [Elusimicrobiota bacterium]